MTLSFFKKTKAEYFNKFFSEIAPKLPSKIPHSLISFEKILHGDYPSLEEKPITDEELNEALQTLKQRKPLDMMRFLLMLSNTSHHQFLSL